jgi:hypothetical protein
MKKSQVAVNGGASFVAVPATIWAHSVKVIELGLTPVGLVVQWPDDNFTASYNYAAGAVIRKSGHNVYSALARPANSAYGNTPPTADNYMKVKASDNSTTKIIELTEYELGEDAAS